MRFGICFCPKPVCAKAQVSEIGEPNLQFSDIQNKSDTDAKNATDSSRKSIDGQDLTEREKRPGPGLLCAN